MDSAKFAFIVALTALALGCEASAADLGVPYEPPPAAPMEEFGAGWYLRGDVGYADMKGYNVDPSGNLSNHKNRDNWVMSIGGGYRFNEWLRADLNGEYHDHISNSGIGSIYACQNGANAVYNDGGSIVGSTLSYSPCQNNYRDKITTWAMFANAYVDLGTWFNVTPYVGGGIGFSYNRFSNYGFYALSNGTSADTSWVDPYTGLTTLTRYSTSQRSTEHDFAWNVGGGIAVNITQQAAIDIGYRYARFGQLKYIDPYTSATRKVNIESQEVRAGLRYLID